MYDQSLVDNFYFYRFACPLSTENVSMCHNILCWALFQIDNVTNTAVFNRVATFKNSKYTTV